MMAIDLIMLKSSNDQLTDGGPPLGSELSTGSVGPLFRSAGLGPGCAASSAGRQRHAPNAETDRGRDERKPRRFASYVVPMPEEQHVEAIQDHNHPKNAAGYSP
jgi:hypothetical protein